MLQTLSKISMIESMIKPVGDHLWQRGTNCGGVSCLGGTSCSAASSPGGPSMVAATGLGGPVVAWQVTCPVYICCLYVCGEHVCRL